MNINVNTTTIEGLELKSTKQTKLIVVPAHSFGIKISEKDELKEALENFKKLFKDKDEYIFILDYRYNAYFDAINLDDKKEERKNNSTPYTYPLFDEPYYNRRYEKGIDWNKVYCDSNDTKIK